MGERWSIWLAPRLAAPHRGFAIAHELAEWAHRHRRYECPEALCDATAAAIVAPSRAFVSQLTHGEPNFSRLAAAFRTTESCVALRIGEVTGRPVALVTPARVRVRGEEWSWPLDTEIRRLGGARDHEPLRIVRLRDDPRRTVILAA